MQNAHFNFQKIFFESILDQSGHLKIAIITEIISQKLQKIVKSVIF